MVDNPTAAIKTAFPDQKFVAGDSVSFGSSGEKFTYTADGKFESAGKAEGGASASSTPNKWDGPEDARKKEGAGKYPNYYTHKTRSGHSFMMDDSKGAESVTLQHRTGSMIQMGSDGVVHLRAQNGQYQITFGENRIYVSGAQDITVDGAASLTVKQDYNIKAKNVNLTAEEDFNITARNVNTTARGAVDTIGKSKTDKFEGSVSIQSVGGAMMLKSKYAFLAASLSDTLMLAGMNDVSVLSNLGKIMLKSYGRLSALSATSEVVLQGKNISASATENIKVSAGDTASIYGASATGIKSGGLAYLTATSVLHLYGSGIKYTPSMSAGASQFSEMVTTDADDAARIQTKPVPPPSS
jgi:hypothetical protein